MIIRLTQFVKLAIVALLRVAFGHESTPEDYRYSDDEKLSKIQIYREFPRRIFRPPAIVVNANAGDANISVLGPEEKYYTEGDTTTVGGLVSFPVTISVYAATTTDRENLVDLLVFFFRFVFRKKLNLANINYTKISVLGESKEEWFGQNLYKGGVQLAIFTENMYQVPEELVNLIERINLNILVEEPEIN